MSEYLEFVKTGDTGKTGVYTVHAGGSRLGVIKWYGPLRQYVLFAGMGTVWNPGCLEDVIAFLNGLMAERAREEVETL